MTIFHTRSSAIVARLPAQFVIQAANAFNDTAVLCQYPCGCVLFVPVSDNKNKRGSILIVKNYCFVCSTAFRLLHSRKSPHFSLVKDSLSSRHSPSLVHVPKCFICSIQGTHLHARLTKYLLTRVLFRTNTGP